MLKRWRSRPPELPGSDLLELPGPDALQVRARMLGIGSHLTATLVVTGYPAEVAPGWLDPLLNYPGRLDVAFHIEPIPGPVAAERLKKQRARLEASRRTSFGKGQIDDPEADAAAQDAAELAYVVARGEGRLFRVALYLTVHAPDIAALEEELAAVQAVASSLLISTAPATFRALPAWLATLPFGIDTLGIRRTFDTASLAACFPFTSPDLPAPRDGSPPTGVLYGLNCASGAPVIYDRFAQENYNSITLARSGAGKSYATKLELLRLLFTGVQAAVIDPEDEYVCLADTVGGRVVRLGADGVRLNPLDLPATDHEGEADAAPEAGGDALTRRLLFLHSFLSVLFATELTAPQKAALDRALLTVYRRAGITHDPRTWKRTAPTLGDLADVLEEDNSETAGDLAARLMPYTTGSHADLFNGPTTTPVDGHLVVFALRQLADEVHAPAMMLTLDVIWRRVTSRTVPCRQLVVVDEAWLLMREGEGARFLFRAAKSFRKHWTGLAVVTQDVEDVLSTQLGRAVVSNAATQLLLGQSTQAIDGITKTFHLSHGEREFLLAAQQGEALLQSGERHKVALLSVAAPEEHDVITTNPAELAFAETEEDA
ncbi:VirB4 family type IV secretion system protein [Streptomyces sp. B15]|uniref:VirB4 family type IV secretion system protein n=1 Tax=Streptomyces sp. B15 TaxID=1537797 RepID=UPI001B398759|nr:conjugal transfer protein TraC [Streptomyces sp. B15]MBQ1123757.1 conjugal transfer protein TraC [Streptomyces sp. B15]